MSFQEPAIPETVEPGPAGVAESQEGTAALHGIVDELSGTMSEAVSDLTQINFHTHLLALNARVEAARVGNLGAAFAVVAEEMQMLSNRTSQVAQGLAKHTQSKISDLNELIGNNIRGTRLSDLALTNIDLVDRNLYERTCDVRWWATDSSLVDALTHKSTEAYDHASQRLGVILSAYTVYHDLVLCDLNGVVVANGRPDLYGSVGESVGAWDWFQQAAASRSGDEYGFETAHRSTLVDGKPVLIYSCGVREGGQADGRLLGVLGILFNWEEFAQTIVQEVPLTPDERKSTRVVLCDDSGKLLADSFGRQLVDEIHPPQMESLFALKKDYRVEDYEGAPTCIAHAQAPGFETYTTGWHSLIIQPIDNA